MGRKEDITLNIKVRGGLPRRLNGSEREENNWGMPSGKRNSKCKGPEVAVPSVKEEKHI